MGDRRLPWSSVWILMRPRPAGLLNLHRQLPGYQSDFLISRVLFNNKPVPSGKVDPTTLPITFTPNPFLIPGVAKSPANLDMDYGAFKSYLAEIIGRQYVENPSKEVHPPVLTGVTCR